jgi:hypothetical protein
MAPDRTVSTGLAVPYSWGLLSVEDIGPALGGRSKARNRPRSYWEIQVSGLRKGVPAYALSIPVMAPNNSRFEVNGNFMKSALIDW